MKIKPRMVAEALVLVSLIGALFYLSTAKAQDNCTTTCQWIGDQWVCETVCY